MANANIIDTTDATFQADVLDNNLPVIVDFWAEWCGPCKQIAPILDELATDYAGKVQIAKVNTDHCREIPSNFGISGLPTLIAFKNGEVVGRMTGFRGRQDVEKFVTENL